MNYRVLLLVCALSVAAAFSASWAQGAAAADSAGVRNPAVNNNAAAPDSALQKTAAGDSIAAGKSAAKGLDLDKLLSDDHPEEDLLVGEKPAAKPAAVDTSLSADSTSPPSVPAEPAGELAADEKAPVADTSAASAAVTRVTAKTDSADLAPLVINDGRTINFAQNLKEYRSPRVAMLLSLLVPGLGQAYSRSYVKAGGFVAAEVVVIGVTAYLNSVGEAKKRDAHKFADENFDPERLREYETRLRDYDEQLRQRPGDNLEGIDTSFLSYYDAEFYSAAAERRTLYYENIRDPYFTPGWKDSDPVIDDLFSDRDTIQGAHGVYVRYKPDVPELLHWITRVVDKAGRAVNDGPMLGFSPAQVEYNAMIKNSNSYHDAANYALYALLLNHIASAIDAGFTARAYNARLLGRESAWGRVSVETQYVFTGSDVSPGLALRVRF